MRNTVCQLIGQALLYAQRPLSIPELTAMTGISGRDLVPVVNKMLGIGTVVLIGRRVARPKMREAEGF
jgi:DNA-binding transcriptional regulator GbsR (MarR family)